MSMSDSSDTFVVGPRKRAQKRRKVHTRRPEGRYDWHNIFSLSLTPGGDPEDATSFEDFVRVLLPEYLQARTALQVRESEIDSLGQRVRPLSRHEVSSFVKEAESKQLTTPLSSIQSICLRKLKLQRERRKAGLPETLLKKSYEGSVGSLPSSHPPPAVNFQVIDALYSIKTTPYESSFMSRLVGEVSSNNHGVIAVDWETVSPWMHLMKDIRDHYSLAHPVRELPNETLAPTIYMSLQPHHLVQVHDLLARVFWNGIDVTDSLNYSPERCTVIATYKRLVVGVAFLSSPQETYITYLAVRAGWENAQIATTMLYHLVTLNPKKDITLHVSANNPAMLLYNRFGFKAEEFVVGFYDDYLDPESRASKNAFRLRLRR